MTSAIRTIAIMAANSAFTAILGRALEDGRGHRVACFSTTEALVTFMRISPVDVVVLDADVDGAAGQSSVRGLRSHPRLANPQFDLLVLTRAETAFHRPFLLAGADAVLRKPVSPARLMVSVDDLLHGRGSQAAAQQETRAFRPAIAGHQDLAARQGNVISLFGEHRV